MKKLTCKIAGALSVLVLASVIVGASAGSPEFSLFASPSAQWISPAQLAHYSVSVRAAEGFAGDVLLRCRPNSQLITCSVLPKVVHVGPGAWPTPEILMLASASAGTPIGKYSIEIIGSALPAVTGGTQGENKVTVTLGVLPVVDPPKE
jgi:hypothetical protein